MATLVRPIDYRVFDADNHYYEPLDLFERYIAREFRDRTFQVQADADADGNRVVTFDGKPFGFVGGSGPFARIRPGSLRKRVRGELPPDDEASRHDGDTTYAAEPAARIELMDRQGIEATLIFPSTGVTIENRLRHDPELLAAHVAAFNRWIDDAWSFDYRRRIFAPAIISLVDVDFAVAQLEFALARGARLVQLMPGPATWGRSPADECYDPFWARVNESATLVTFHLGNSGYQERYSPDWGEHPDPDGLDGPAPGRSAFQWTMFYRDRPIMDTLCNLIFNNLFGRFPNVSVASVENGSIWVPYLLRAMDNMKGMGRQGPWPGGYVEGRPSEIFKRHVFVSPHHYGEDIGEIIDLLGPSRVLFGSDFPHPEGMSDVDDYQERTAELVARVAHPDDEIRMMMRENGMRLLGLAPLAPTPSEPAGP
jgi:predicted TIM-barrel fold metal-dependent hydrolase